MRRAERACRTARPVRMVIAGAGNPLRVRGSGAAAALGPLAVDVHEPGRVAAGPHVHGRW